MSQARDGDAMGGAGQKIVVNPPGLITDEEKTFANALHLVDTTAIQGGGHHW